MPQLKILDEVAAKREYDVPNLKFLIKNENVWLIQNEFQLIVEQKPQRRTVFIEQDIFPTYEDMQNTKLKVRPYNLAFPYVYFVLKMRKMQKMQFNEYKLIRINAFSKVIPLNRISDNVSIVNLPNVAENGEVCLGDQYFAEYNLTKLVDDVIAYFWQSEFNGASEYFCDYLERSSKFTVKDLTDPSDEIKDCSDFLFKTIVLNSSF